MLGPFGRAAMSDLSPVSGSKRKLGFWAVRAAFDPTETSCRRPHSFLTPLPALGLRAFIAMQQIASARADIHLAVDYTIFRNAPVTDDIRLPVGIFALVCDHW